MKKSKLTRGEGLQRQRASFQSELERDTQWSSSAVQTEGLSATAVEKALRRNGAVARGREQKVEEPLQIAESMSDWKEMDMDMDIDMVDILGNITLQFYDLSISLVLFLYAVIRIQFSYSCFSFLVSVTDFLNRLVVSMAVDDLSKIMALHWKFGIGYTTKRIPFQKVNQYNFEFSHQRGEFFYRKMCINMCQLNLIIFMLIFFK